MTNNKFLNKFLRCDSIHPRFDKYIVSVTEEELLKTLNEWKRPVEGKVNSVILSRVYRNVVQYDNSTLSQHASEDTLEWKNWCNDVCLYLTGLNVLSEGKVPIPVVEL